MGKFLNAVCILLYGVSALAALFIVSKVIDVRSKCTDEKKRISALVSEIRELKDENNRLMVEYYSKVKPKLTDEGSAHLKDLHENEVEYVK